MKQYNSTLTSLSTTYYNLANQSSLMLSSMNLLTLTTGSLISGIQYEMT